MAQKPKDFAGMMAGPPQASPMPAPAPAAMGGAMPAGAGAMPPMPPMPEGQAPQNKSAAKADRLRESILKALEDKGVMAKVANDMELQEIMTQVDQLTEAIVNGDKMAIKDNPVTALLGGEIPGEANERG